ncbi:thiosulfate oxidation carrier protein SoxY [uncultured Roseobacter sp.]|uniref:thiosulfate oxidation carrier protein SoxY n=1 Tax=uncultured Roseobacter sp. TaxID=114847 RepID=UPI00261895A7|nr:thiosulfate oxidation carrier protein SoxY [uncultured Roseobacter sp.]
MLYARRDMLMSGSATLIGLGLPLPSLGQEIDAQDAIHAFANGADIVPGEVTLMLPDVAEDGFKVPIEVAAEGAEALLIIAPKNPVPPLAMVQFGTLAADRRFSTRVRLARSQEIMALARMPGGAILRASRQVEVIVGGCGA